MVDTLFSGAISRAAAAADYDPTIKQTVEVHSITHGLCLSGDPPPVCGGLSPPEIDRPPPPTHPAVIQEKGVRLKLTVTDTPGFGDLIDNTERFGLWGGDCAQHNH